jgi:EAL domain-containing protein (putative c-di-GMP-specific phosphodiesterase class I)
MDWLTDLEFPDLVAGLASEAGALPGNLMLEVAGSHLATDLRVGLEILTRLRLQGFGLSVNAFGPQELPPARLRDIPFSELKLDRAFVAAARRDPAAGAAFASSVALGRQLGVTVVAEGVENIDDWRYVHGTGCGAAQGYFVAEPMRADALPAWAARWPRRFADELAP